mgnify:CR=1 FL=1
MRRVRDPKARDEHLIFVKNVPAHMATHAVPDLYAAYKPLRIKNVYPNSDITTVVVGFRTHREASYAQQDTDGLRLESVVLRVESYSKHRSVRHLREGRIANRPLGTVDENDDDEEDEQPESRPDSDSDYDTLFPFFVGQVQPDTTGTTTWAQIAKQTRQPQTTQPMVSSSSPRLKHPTVSEEAKKLPALMAIAEPHHASKNVVAESRSEIDEADAQTDAVLPRSPNTTSTEIAAYDGDIEDNSKTRNPPSIANAAPYMSTGILAPWEPIDTSERIRQRHCRDCRFCQMRNRG